MNKQTAVEWLEKEVNGTFYVAQASEMAKRFKKIFEEAKEMEKEQIEKAHGNKIRQDIEHSIDVYLITTGEQYYNETYGGHIVNTNEMVDQVPDVRKMVEDDVAPIDWLINQLENHIVLSAHNKLGTNRTGDYRIGLRKAIDFCHQAKEMESKETLYTEEQVRDAIDMARSQSGYASYEFKENEIIQSLKQPKQ